METLTTLILCIAFHSTSMALPTTEVTENHEFVNNPYYDPTKNNTLFTCGTIDLNPGEYTLFPNETVYIEAYNLKIEPAHYLIINGSVIFCSSLINFDSAESDEIAATYVESIISGIGMGVSMVCMILHLIVFAIVKDLRNLPGYNLASLCVSLVMAHFCFLMGNQLEFGRENQVCVVLASCSHFFFLASFMWTSVMAIDVYKSLLNATGKLRLASAHFSMKKFLFYSCYAWGAALVIAVSTIIIDRSSFVPEWYRPLFGQGQYCWFTGKVPLLIYFAIPVFIVTITNLIIFGLSAFTVCSNSMRTDNESQKTALNNNFKLYSRLAIIMGLTWVVGIVASSVHKKWLWYLFIFLNAFQGLFIFVAFTCASKVRNHFKRILGIDDRRPSTATTLTPTFQSYANSVEKDLDGGMNCDKTVNGVDSTP